MSQKATSSLAVWATFYKCVILIITEMITLAQCRHNYATVHYMGRTILALYKR